jgi:hypothetical protein
MASYRLIAAIPLLSLIAPAGAQPVFPEIQLNPAGGGVHRPTTMAVAGDGSRRWFVTEQEGTIRILRDGLPLETPFLDIRDRVTQIDPLCCDERGLLSVAFPPEFLEKQYFYVFYTDHENAIVVSRFHVGEDPDLADPASEEVILRIEHYYENHFGGQLAFNPFDGMLYISVGDGGGGGDPYQAGQDPDQLYGKILRIDVENGATAAEAVAMGLRNPWRFSFDRETGDLYIGDVGENAWEEINFRPANDLSIWNYEWSVFEGTLCRVEECEMADGHPPIGQFSHDEGCSVTAGFVYRGGFIEELVGTHVFADFCRGTIWGLAWHEGLWYMTQLAGESGLNFSTFGEDEDGELYVVEYSTGEIYHIVPATPREKPPEDEDPSRAALPSRGDRSGRHPPFARGVACRTAA